MSNTIKAAIQALKGRIADAYTAVSAKGGTLPATQDSANLPTAIASIPSGGGSVLPNGWEFYITPNTINDVVFNFSIDNKGIKKINDDVVTQIDRALFYSTGVQEIKMSAVTRMASANDCVRGNLKLTKAEFPSLGYTGASFIFAGNTALKILSLPACYRLVNSNTFTNTPNLIDITIGSAMTDSFSMVTWNPTNALSSSSSSLVDAGETFANNLEKLLYNIRNHIAANLPDRTGLSALTITFSANVKSAINADTATAQAFSNKNWTIA